MPVDTGAMAYETSIEIDAAQEHVWAVLTDVERWPEWTASMQKVERQDDGDLVLGSRVRIKQPRVPAVIWVVTELDPGRAFSWTVAGPGVTTVAKHRIEPVDASAVRVHLAISRRGPLAGVISALSAALTRRYVGMEARGLKKRCESG